MADKLIIPSKGLQQALTKCLGCVNSVAPQLEYLQRLATATPEIAASVDELAEMHAHLDQLARVGLGGITINDADMERG